MDSYCRLYLVILVCVGYFSTSYSFSSSHFARSHLSTRNKSYKHLYASSSSTPSSIVPTFLDQDISRLYYDLPGKLVNVSVVESLPRNAGLSSSSTTIILVTIGIRRLDDIELPEETNWNSFKQRLIKSDQTNLADDKFLFSHEIVSSMDNPSSVMILSRIPIEMFQKLELARKVVDLAKGEEINVIMLDLFGERVLDLAMGEAIQAALQVSLSLAALYLVSSVLIS